MEILSVAALGLLYVTGAVAFAVVVLALLATSTKSRGGGPLEFFWPVTGSDLEDGVTLSDSEPTLERLGVWGLLSLLGAGAAAMYWQATSGSGLPFAVFAIVLVTLVFEITVDAGPRVAPTHFVLFVTGASAVSIALPMAAADGVTIHRSAIVVVELWLAAVAGVVLSMALAALLTGYRRESRTLVVEQFLLGLALTLTFLTTLSVVLRYFTRHSDFWVMLPGLEVSLRSSVALTAYAGGRTVVFVGLFVYLLIETVRRTVRPDFPGRQLGEFHTSLPSNVPVGLGDAFQLVGELLMDVGDAGLRTLLFCLELTRRFGKTAWTAGREIAGRFGRTFIWIVRSPTTTALILLALGTVVAFFADALHRIFLSDGGLVSTIVLMVLIPALVVLAAHSWFHSNSVTKGITANVLMIGMFAILIGSIIVGAFTLAGLRPFRIGFVTILVYFMLVITLLTGTGSKGQKANGSEKGVRSIDGKEMSEPTRFISVTLSAGYLAAFLFLSGIFF